MSNATHDDRPLIVGLGGTTRPGSSSERALAVALEAARELGARTDLIAPDQTTALTRAQRHLSVVHAAGPAVARAVRHVGARPRRTRLRELLVEYADPAAITD